MNKKSNSRKATNQKSGREANGRYKKKGYTSRRSEEDRSDYRADANMKAENDISWYSRNPSLLAAAANFPFPNRPGMQLNIIDTNKPEPYTIPGIMVLDWMPWIGDSATATDPASIMAKEIYAKVRSVFSGSLDADPPDYVVYLMALDSIFSYIAYLKRIYRILNAYTPDNYVLPDVVLGSMGFTDAEIQTLRLNKSQLWQAINELVLTSRKFTCPAQMDIFNRHYWMSDNVYTDAPTVNSQFYMFNLARVFIYQNTLIPGTTSDYASGLAPIRMPTFITGATRDCSVQGLFNFGLRLINALVAWDDAYTINGYLKKAYEGVPNFIVDELPADQPFNPVYEPEVLLQIENSRTVRLGNKLVNYTEGNLSGLYVAQNPLSNAIVTSATVTVTDKTDTDMLFSRTTADPRPRINIREFTPDAKACTIATRLQAYCDITANSSTETTMTIHAATEIPFCWRLCNGVAAASATSGNVVPGVYNVVHQLFVPNLVAGGLTVQQIADVYSYISTLGKLETFDWHPFVTAFWNNGLAGAPYQQAGMTLYGDLGNIAIISKEDLLNLHKVCVLSEINAFAY